MKPDGSRRSATMELAPLNGNHLHRFSALFLLGVLGLLSFSAPVVQGDEAAGSVLRPIAADSDPGMFFAGPVPRSAAIAQDARLNDVCSVGSRCWAVGERAVIVQSEDAGSSWQTLVLPFECSLQSVCFLTDRIGWVAGMRFHPRIHGRSLAVLMQTRDGGRTWSVAGARQDSEADFDHSPDEVATEEIPGILKISFFGLDEAIAVTLPVSRLADATILRTRNGGRSWAAVPCDSEDGRFTAGAFISATEGIVGGEQQLYGTMVADQVVTIGRPLPTLKQIRGLHLSVNGDSWIVGDAAFVLTSDNFGVTWKAVDIQLPARSEQLLDLHSVTQRGAVLLTGGSPGSVVLRSDDGGRHWTRHATHSDGEIRRLVFVDDQHVIALSSLGTILRSSDAGCTWISVRSAEHRAGLLAIATELQHSPWELLAVHAGDQGVRAVTAQISPRLGTGIDGRDWQDFEYRRLLEVRQTTTQLGANDVVTEWSFPRNRPEHHLAMDQLISEWNRRTDGELRRQLPLRLARLMRIWQPSAVIVEPVGDDDAVAQLMVEVLPIALELAASNWPESMDQTGTVGEPTSSEVLSQLFLKPWTVSRVVVRSAANHTTALTWRDSDLLNSSGTTIGLLTKVVDDHLFDSTESGRGSIGRVSYELVPVGRDSAVTPPTLFHGLSAQLDGRARRVTPVRSQEEIQLLQRTAQSAQTQQAAVLGHLQLATTENSMIAQLQRVGSQLPEPLALRQLTDLADVNLRSNNIDSYLSVQQELIRRFPATADGLAAAEVLFLYYSSAEMRRFRFNQMMRRQQEIDRRRQGSPLGIAGQNMISPNIAANEFPSATTDDPASGVGISTEPLGSAPAFAVSPRFEPASTVTFGHRAADHAESLTRQWDQQAAAALQILKSVPGESLATSVLLRQAANARLQQRSGEYSGLLAEVASRNDRKAVFATSESQAVHGIPNGPVRIVNIRRTARRPRLDAMLNDECWQHAEEIFLTADPLTSTRPESRTLVMLSWDDQFLYVAARLESLQSRAIRQVSASSDEALAVDRFYDESHGRRDRLELHVDVDRDYATAFRFTVDQTGRTSEACHLLTAWNPEWYVAVDHDREGWRLELAIPLQELDLNQTRAGDLWSIRLRRVIPGQLLQTLVSESDSPGNSRRTLADEQGRCLIRFIRNPAR